VVSIFQKNKLLYQASDTVTRVNDSTRVTVFGDSDSSHLQKNGDSTRITFFIE